MTWGKWETICKIKEEGWLGVIDLRRFNLEVEIKYEREGVVEENSNFKI